MSDFILISVFLLFELYLSRSRRRSNAEDISEALAERDSLIDTLRSEITDIRADSASKLESAQDEAHKARVHATTADLKAMSAEGLLQSINKRLEADKLATVNPAGLSNLPRRADTAAEVKRKWDAMNLADEAQAAETMSVEEAIRPVHVRHESKPSDFKSLPDGVRAYNGGTRCDMWTGPCACGAWHDHDQDKERGLLASDRLADAEEQASTRTRIETQRETPPPRMNDL